MSGDQEVPPVATDTTGKFKFKLNKAQTEAEFTLSVKSGERIQQAHLHCAPAGVPGPVVVVLSAPILVGYDVDGKWISNVVLTSANVANPACGKTIADLAASMLAGKVYANVHSVAHPTGVVRGQLEQGDDD